MCENVVGVCRTQSPEYPRTYTHTHSLSHTNTHSHAHSQQDGSLLGKVFFCKNCKNKYFFAQSTENSLSLSLLSLTHTHTYTHSYIHIHTARVQLTWKVTFCPQFTKNPHSLTQTHMQTHTHARTHTHSKSAANLESYFLPTIYKGS